MSFSGMLVRDATNIRPGSKVDTRGSTIPDWASPTETTVKAWLHQEDATEDLDGRDAEVTHWTLLEPAGTDLRSGDRVRIDGVTYEVDGPPNRPWKPRSGEHHVMARLKLAVG